MAGSTLNTQDQGNDPLGILQPKGKVVPMQKHDPLGILTPPAAPKPMPQQGPPAIAPLDMRQVFKGATQDLGQLYAQGEQVQQDKNVQDARNNIVKTFNEHGNSAIRGIIQKDIEKKLVEGSGFMPGDPAAKKAWDAQRNAQFSRLLNVSQEAEQYKNDINKDPSKLRDVVHHIAETHPDIAPQLQADMYLLDSKDRPQAAKKINYNVDQIKSGEYGYNIKSGTLTKPEGLRESIGTGFQERNRMMRDYDFYQGKPDADVINKLEVERVKYDPDEPTKTPKGIGGSVGQAIGSQGIVTLKGAAAAGATGLIPGVGEALAPWVSAAVTSPEFYKTGYVTSLESNYHTLRNSGMSPAEALEKAKDRASFDAKVDVAQGIVATAAGAKIGATPTGALTSELSPGYLNAVKNIALKSGKWLGDTSIHGGAAGAVAAGAQELKNIYAGRPSGQGTVEAGMGQLMFAYGLGTLTKAGRTAINPKAWRAILNQVSKAPEEQVNSTLGQMVNDGSITPDQANEIHNEIQTHKETGMKIGDNITNEESRDKIQELINKRTTLENKLEVVDKAFHPEIKERIDKINEEITSLPRRGGKAEEVPTFKTPIEQAKELVESGAVKGDAGDALKKAAGNPDEFENMLRGIAHQAHDPQAAQVTTETYGPELVKVAKELHPEHTFLEPKEQPPATVSPEESIVPSEKGAGKFEPVKIAGTEVGEHGEDTHTAEEKENGTKDTNLTEKGKAQAKDLGAFVAEKGKEEIMSSEVARAKETAEEAAKESERLGNKVKVSSDPILNTLNIGDADGQPRGSFNENHYLDHPDEEIPGSGGATMNKFFSQMEKAYQFVKELPKTTQVVAHSKVLRAFRSLEETGGKWTEETTKLFKQWHEIENQQLKTKENASNLRSNQGQVHGAGDVAEGGQDQGGQNIQLDEGQKAEPAQTVEQAGQGKPPSVGVGEELPFGRSNLVGIAHEYQKERAYDIGAIQPERGEGITLEESVQHGRDLIAKGADPNEVAENFKKTKRFSHDDISIARAHYENLFKATNEAIDKYGKGSPEAEAAMKTERSWYDNVVRPMKTESHRIFVAQQGRTDVDTGSVVGMERSFEERTGKEFTPAQKEKAKNFVKRVTALRKETETPKDQISKAHDDAVDKPESPKSTTFKEKAKKAADTFRKLKVKEFTFKDSDGNEIPIKKMGVSWNDMVEYGAKAIEKTGEIADGIAAIVEKVKDSDWYKKLSSEDKDRFEKELGDHFIGVADKKTAARIKALEKQLADLQEGKVKSKGAERVETDEEKDLKEQIFQAKVNLGLVKPRATKVQKVGIPQQDISTRFVGKTDSKFSPKDARDIWKYAREKYIDQGASFGAALKNTATDLGLNVNQVLSAIGSPKSARKATNELFKKDYELRKAVNFAQRFVDTADQSSLKRFWDSLPSRVFALKTYGHGTVGNITHAAGNIFRPSVWSAYWPNVIKSFSLAYGKTANYEKAVNQLESSPHFIDWKESGLAVDPRESYDDYQVFGRKQSWVGEMGTRGFTGLKFMRYDLAELWYKNASETERADPNFREQIAQLVNHATGHSEVKVGKAIKVITFAPGLEISRWQRMITDPYKAVKTYAKGSNATPAEKAAAKIVLGGAGQRMAIYTAALAANAGLLSALGSSQKVNWDDPSKSDWLKFKIGDRTLDVTGGIYNPLRILHSIGMEAYLSVAGTKKELRTKPNDKDAQTLWQQLRYKASPIAGDVTELITGQDAMGNVMPWSVINPSKGRRQLTFGEYGVNLLAPIPIAAGFNAYVESMQSQGVPESRIKAIFVGVMTSGIEGFTGAKFTPDYSLENQGGATGGGGAGGTYGDPRIH